MAGAAEVTTFATRHEIWCNCDFKGYEVRSGSIERLSVETVAKELELKKNWQPPQRAVFSKGILLIYVHWALRCTAKIPPRLFIFPGSKANNVPF